MCFRLSLRRQRLNLDSSVKESYRPGVPRPREFDEKQVLRAAQDVFWSKGYAATSVDDLVAATGLGKGSLYGAFGAKHDLFLTVFDRYCSRMVASAQTLLDGPDDGAFDRIAAYVRGSATGSARPNRPNGCLLASATAELAESDPAVAQRSRDTFALIEDVLAAAFAQAQASGAVDAAADPRALARTVLAVTRGVVALGSSGMGEADRLVIAETAIRAFVTSS